MILDRIVVWEWAQRNKICWWNREYTFRQWIEGWTKIDLKKLDLNL